MINKNGLSSFQLKIIAATLMFIDHTAQFFTYLPICFHWFGRLSAPIFFFLSSQGYIHTKSKKKYLVRLLLGFWLMNALSSLLIYYTHSTTNPIPNNIFGTIFISVLYMYFFDTWKNALKAKSLYKQLLCFIIFFLPLYMDSLIIALEKNDPFILYKIIRFLVPLPLSTEGGFFIVLLTVSFYVFRDNKYLQITPLIILSIISYLITPDKSITINYQWMMCFSTIFILCYNGKEGTKTHYFFYLFYPIHIYLLYFLSRLLQ